VLAQPCEVRHLTRLRLRIICSDVHKHADAPHALGLLRSRRERPSGCRAAEQRDEIAAFHW
jgi:hypothetical protein